MSIKINIKHFDGSDFCEDELTYKSKDTLISKLMEDVALKTELLDELKNPSFKLAQGEIDDCGIEMPVKDVFIEVVLIDNPEIFDYFDAPENSLGFHAINSGVYESDDGDVLSKKHRVFIMVDESCLKNIIKNERDCEIDPTSSRNDAEYLKSYLVTVTHELAHCVEFITNANGLTPSDVANENENGNLSWDVREISTGHGILFPYDEDLEFSELVDIMEERVEEKGIKWLDEIKMDESLFNKALSEYSPKGELKQEHPKKSKRSRSSNRM